MEEQKESSSGLDFKLHPLVLINISDHFTRVKANTPVPVEAKNTRVLGCLLGQQTGRIVDISNSFELRYSVTDEGVEIEQDFLLKKQEQYKQVFANLDVVGWYATGSGLQEQDMVVHRKMMELNESPVFLQLDPRVDSLRKDLPVTLFESELHIIEQVPTFLFVQAKYTVETSEAERIGVNQVAKILPSGNSSGSDQLTAHLTSMHSAMKMMNNRISILLQVLDKMVKGEIPLDHGLLRKASSLAHRLPAIQSTNFQKDFLVEYNDAMLTIMMSSVTKGLSSLNEIVDKFNVAYERAPGSRRMMR